MLTYRISVQVDLLLIRLVGSRDQIKRMVILMLVLEERFIRSSNSKTLTTTIILTGCKLAVI
jgi:hypothetical protein